MIYALRSCFVWFTFFYLQSAVACDFSEFESAFFRLSAKEADHYLIHLDLKGVILPELCDDFSIVSIHGNAFSISFNDLSKNTHIISGKYEKAAYLPILNKTISKGDIIDHSFLQMKKIPNSLANSYAVLRIEDAVGKVAKKTLNPNRIIFRYEIEKKLIVRRNDQLDVVFKKGEVLELRIKAVALEGGAIGDKIRLKNISSKKEVIAEVKSKDEAYVSIR